MTGREVVSKINETACFAAEHNRTPRQAQIGSEAWIALVAHLEGKLSLDIHEVCGDYDNPKSPWYGSRPAPISAIELHTPAGKVSVIVRPTLQDAVIVEDTRGEPWIVT